MVSRVYYLRSQAWLTRKEAGGGLHAGGLGLGPGMGAGQRVPSVAEEGARLKLERTPGELSFGS